MIAKQCPFALTCQEHSACFSHNKHQINNKSHFSAFAAKNKNGSNITV